MKKHSVLLKEDLCEGCINCVKNCPTRAIRVHQGKATIKDELCIDCAECIKTCAYHAKYSKTASFAEVSDYKYPIVLIPPSFYGQFKGIFPTKIREALFKMGFKDVLDVSLAAEALSRKTSDFLKSHSGVFISSSCPVVVRLIKILYPELVEHLIPFKSPVDALAEKAKYEAIEKGDSCEDMGVFLITPCPAKNTATFSPIGIDKSFVDKTISASLAYQAVLELLVKDSNCVEDNTSATIPYLGMGWGQSGGELKLLEEGIQNRSLSVSGIHRVKSLLDELSRNNIKDVKYFELAACNYGCVGGVFNVVNVFQARSNLRSVGALASQPVKQGSECYHFDLLRDFEPAQNGQLDSNLAKAMEKLEQLEIEIKILPGLDCAACGAPDCRTLAEDIVNGMASRSDCVFLLRKQVGNLADQMLEMVSELPPVMKGKRKSDDQ